MAASSRETREAKRRIQQMEAKRELRRDQDKRRKRDNLLAVGAGAAAVVLAVVLQLTVFSANPTEEEFAAARGGLTTPSASASAIRAPTNAANIPKPDTAAGKTFTGELKLNSGALGVELDGTKAPPGRRRLQVPRRPATTTGVSCHRLTTAENFGVLQCGSKTGDGAGRPELHLGSAGKHAGGQQVPGRHHRRGPDRRTTPTATAPSSSSCTRTPSFRPTPPAVTRWWAR